MGELSKLPNIGLAVEGQLIKVGITTKEELASLGSMQAWLRIKKIDDSACIHRLYALQGAIEGVKKTQLDPKVKAELKAFYDSHK